jgi:hypothetical protein
MSLLLNGAKTMTIAGTEMQCLEIYTGEAYTLPFAFTDSTGSPINANGWTLGTTAKFYNVDTVEYPNEDEVVLGNLSLLSPQPSTGAGTYSANLTAAFTTASSGLGYIYIPANLTGGTGSPNATPIINLANNSANSALVIITMAVTRTDPLSSLVNVNREPFGIIVRYQ